jgi:hypothetical protein
VAFLLFFFDKKEMKNEIFRGDIRHESSITVTVKMMRLRARTTFHFRQTLAFWSEIVRW